MKRDPSTKPAAARRWLAAAIPDGTPDRTRIWVGQQGSLESDGRWLSFKGTGTYQAAPLSYDWRARLKVKFGVWILIKDGYDDDEGWGGSWLYGVRSLAQRSGPEVLAIQVIRNLAELVWVPDLARAEPGLHWSAAGDDAFEITRRAGDRDVAVRFEVDDRGDVVRATGTRPYDVPEGYEDAPWRCEFGAHREFGGVRVPSTMTSTYDLADDPWEYLHVEVTSIDRDDGSQR